MPFTYYGIKDDIDYSEISCIRQRYDQEQLKVEQLQEERVAYIYEKWQEYKQTRTLGFCSSIAQAEFLTDYFNERGVQAVSLTSATHNLSRGETIRKLEL